MKPLRLFFRSSSIALLCMLTFSCVDQTYDTTKISTKAEILENGMDLPIGAFEVTMDSIFKDMDKSVLKVKNGVYTFCVGGSMNLDAVNSSLSGFTPAPLPIVAPTMVNLIDASLYTIPYVVPTSFDQSPFSTAVVNLPDFKTSLMNPVDSPVSQHVLHQEYFNQ
ncbi:MAG: hypothetical protein NTY32_12510 [Bacteroidia bacterium]|nr:hypothetical protein [Bacteroidia bacterium]